MGVYTITDYRHTRQTCKKLDDVVANEHLDKCARMCWTDIWVTGSQNGIEKPEGTV